MRNNRATGTSTRPLLGLMCCLRDREGDSLHVVADRYVRAVAQQTGAALVLLPALAGEADAHAIAQHLDAVLLTGSPSNVEPALYGASGDENGPFDSERDRTSLDLIAAMIANAKPVFGICRGFQELNVAFGGTLEHIGKTELHHADTDIVGPKMFSHRHLVELASDGMLAKATTKARIEVNSVHYQAIARLGAGLRVEALAPDGVVEAFAATATPAPVFAVQWHPEWEAGQTPSSEGFFKIVRGALGTG